MPDPVDLLLSKQQVADILRVSRGYVNKVIGDELGCLKAEGRYVRESTLWKWIDDDDLDFYNIPKSTATSELGNYPGKGLLTVPELSKMLNLPYGTITSMYYKYGMPLFDIVGHTRVKVDSFLSWLPNLYGDKEILKRIGVRRISLLIKKLDPPPIEKPRPRKNLLLENPTPLPGVIRDIILTPSEVGEYLKVSEAIIKKANKFLKLPHFFVGKKQRTRAAILMAFITHIEIESMQYWDKNWKKTSYGK